MENSNAEKGLKDDETEEQQHSSIRENKNPYFASNSSESDFEYEFTCEVCNKTFSGLKPLRQHEKGSQHLKRVRKKEIEKKLVRNLEGDSVENEDDDLEQAFFAVCKTCKKDFMGPESLELHLKSSAHKKKMAAAKLLKEIRDEDGNINLEKLSQKRKEKSKKRVSIVVGKRSEPISRQKASELLDENKGASGYSGPPISSDDSIDDDTIAETHEFECLDCKKVFTGVNPWYQHLVSKVHEKALKQKELFDKLRIAGTSLSKESSTDQYLVQEEDDIISCRLCNVAFSGPESAVTHLKSKKHVKNLELIKWKKSMRQNREGLKGVSKVKKQRAYSESSVQKSSEIGSESYEQDAKEKQISQQEDRQKFSRSEELAFGHGGYQSVPEEKSNKKLDRDTNLESSIATGDSSGARKPTDQTNELQQQCGISSTCVSEDYSKKIVSQDETILKSFQETYI